jgi:hypothetical protein
VVAVRAQSAPDFFKDREVFMEIGYSPGGAYDVYARAVARFIGHHIPGNPTVVPKNLEGAGSLRLANWLYNVAARDGTEMGTIGRGIAFDPLLGNPGVDFDPLKFTWLGSANNEVSVCVSWSTSGCRVAANISILHHCPGAIDLRVQALGWTEPGRTKTRHIAEFSGRSRLSSRGQGCRKYDRDAPVVSILSCKGARADDAGVRYPRTSGAAKIRAQNTRYLDLGA